MKTSSRYTVSQAFNDGWQAIRFNLQGFLLALLFTAVISLPLGLIMAGVVLLGIDVLVNNPSFFGGLFAIAGFLLVLIAGFLLQAFMSNMINLTVADGSREKISDINSIVKKAYDATPRVALAMAYVLPFVLLPILLLGVITGLLTAFSGVAAGSIAVVFGILAVVIIFVIIISRYALVPYVALFEPKLTPRESLPRSWHLLKNDGQWFLLKGFSLVLALTILSSAVSGSLSSEPKPYQLLLSNLLSIIISLLTQAALVAFYFNRKAVRK